jgi:hypothetical protein
VKERLIDLRLHEAVHVIRQPMSIKYLTGIIGLVLCSCAQTDKKQTVVLQESLSVRDSGRRLFEMNCSSCHAPQRTLVAPPFQRIREANGLEWSLSWVRNSQGMIKQRDTNALYIFYCWNMLVQVDFPSLSNKEIESIFDYVDSYPFDSSKYEHRKPTKMERWAQIDSIEKAQKEQWDLIGDTTTRTRTRTRKNKTSS